MRQARDWDTTRPDKDAQDGIISAATQQRIRQERSLAPSADDQADLRVSSYGFLSHAEFDPYNTTGQRNLDRARLIEEGPLDIAVARKPACPTCHLHGPCDCRWDT